MRAGASVEDGDDECMLCLGPMSFLSCYLMYVACGVPTFPLSFTFRVFLSSFEVHILFGLLAGFERGELVRWPRPDLMFYYLIERVEVASLLYFIVSLFFFCFTGVICFTLWWASPCPFSCLLEELIVFSGFLMFSFLTLQLLAQEAALQYIPRHCVYFYDADNRGQPYLFFRYFSDCMNA